MAKNIDILVRAKDATANAWKSVNAHAKKMGRSLKKALSGAANFGKQAAAGIALVGAAAVTAAQHFIGFASAAEEVDTKFQAVFASTIKTARAMSQDLAKSFDLADSTAKQMLADTGDLLTGFGFSGEAALEMSDKVNRLAIDLASFTNYSKGASGASQALTKLLLGETEQAKSLGIVVRQGSQEYKDAVAAKVRDEGLSLLQAKAMTALEMATAQSKNAIGDYARTQDGVANRQRKANEAFKQAREELGAAIIEHSNYGDILNMVAEKTRELTESGLIELWAQNVAAAIEWMSPVLTGVGEAFKGIKKTIQETAAFWGAVSAGSSFTEASQISTGMSDEIKKDRDERLKAIKDEKAARATARAEREAAMQADAIAREKIEKATRKQEAAEKAATKAAEKAAQMQERAARAAEKRANNIKELAAVEKRIAQFKANERIGMFEKNAAQAEKNIADAQKKIAAVAETREERREKRREEIARDKENKRDKELRDRQARKVKLSERDLAFLAKRDEMDRIVREKENLKVANENAEERRKTMAENQRKQMIAELQANKKLLQDNLKAV